MQPTNPDSMATDERTTEIAGILALGLVRAVRSQHSTSRNLFPVISVNQNTL